MARQVTLIVEDGTIVPDANSFVTEDQIVAYAIMRGVTLPFLSDAEKDAVAVLGIKAMDYLRAMPWRGDATVDVQSAPWPRQNLYVTPHFPDDAIPVAVMEAQFQLALLAHGGLVLLPTATGTGQLIKEKIGPIENMYSEKVGVSKSGLPIIPGVAALLDKWLLSDLGDTIPVSIRSLGSREYGG